jgi:hypothetical protein
MRYRRVVLESGGSEPAAKLVQNFLGRPESLDALKHWMDKGFEPAPAMPGRRRTATSWLDAEKHNTGCFFFSEVFDFGN